MPDFKIVTDAMFGKLGKFLRILGFDTHLADNSWADSKILKYAIEENRILITRDELFFKMAQFHYKKNQIDEKYLIYMPYQDLEHQLALFFKKCNIPPQDFHIGPVDSQSFESRCTKCNSEVRRVEKIKILHEISRGTAENYQNFWICKNTRCNQIYWVGHAHWNDIFSKIKAVASIMDEV